MTEIVVQRRTDDYIAYLFGDMRIWDCGQSPEEAIGKLIITHRARFGVTIQERT